MHAENITTLNLNTLDVLKSSCYVFPPYCEMKELDIFLHNIFETKLKNVLNNECPHLARPV